MRCYKCGSRIPPDSRFCQYCGEDLSKMKFCPFCGFQLRDGMNFCSQCGRDLRSVLPAQPGESQDAVPLPEEAVIPVWVETAVIPPEAAPAKSSEKQQRAEPINECPGNAQDSLPERTIENAREVILDPGEAPPVEEELTGENPLPASGDETGETGTAGGGPQRQKKPKWMLPVALCIIAAIAAGVSLWLRNTGESNGQPEPVDVSEIADFVLYLEVFDENDELIGSASGFLVNDQSTLVTNYHVAQEACHIVATDAYGEQSVDVGSILAYDEVADLAILSCDSKASVEPLTVGDSETVRQGDKIYVVGYPLGLANTLSDGIVSSRYLDEYDNDILQVTAAISEGNSGGPLLDANGHVVGVMCAYYVYGQNLNIAIASNTLAALLESGFHKVSLMEWEDRPEIPGYELDEETQEPDAGEPEETSGESPDVVEEVPGGESGVEAEAEWPEVEKPKPEQPKTEPPKTGEETGTPESESAALAEPEDTGEGRAEDPSPWTPTFGPANPNWADTMKAKVDPRFHGTWDCYEVDSFEEQNEIVIDSVVGPPTCSIDLNCGVMSYLFGGSVNNRQNVNGTDQRNTLYKYYKSPYYPYMEEETLVLVSDGLIQATCVRYDTGDGGQTISRIAYYIFTKTSDLTYDDTPYM